jgi:antitoxin (DNA-binding transcriptional repressor) of toxin-antitoxin stability system
MNMSAMTVGELKANFSEVLERLQAGETVDVLYGRAKKPVARIVPMREKGSLPKRCIGLYDGVWKAHITDDFKFRSTDEFLGIA